MGLLNNSNTAFEADDNAADTAAKVDTKAAANDKPATDKVAATGGDTKAKTTAAPAAASTSTAVAVKNNNAVAIAENLRKLEAMKDALPVEYNTLAQMTAQQGNIMDRETKTVLGDTVVFEVLSYQDSFVVSPEDEDAPDDVVRYSNDGVICSDGTDVQVHLTWLKENGYPKARLKQRVIVVGAVQSAAKTDAYNGTLVQFDVAPSSRVQWQRYLANAAYGLKIGKYTEDTVNKVKVETKLAQGGGNNTYTLMQFSVAQ